MTQPPARSSSKPGPKPNPVWSQIRDALARDIAEGRYPPGEKLPSEAALASRFGVNRHTVRRALAEMQAAGLTHARRGAGVFVLGEPLAYRVGRRTRMTQNLAAEGVTGVLTRHRLETTRAGPGEARALGIAPGAPVLVSEGTVAVDDRPITYGQSTFPLDRLPGLEAALSTRDSITDALRACGVPDYRRKSTRLRAERATAALARHLNLPEGAPVLRATSVNVGLQGTPVEFGRTWFASDRIELVVDEEGFS